MSRRIDPRKTVLLVCDIQDRFRSAIWNFDAVVTTSRKMVQAAKLLKLPVVTTEQNPKALGSTVSEISNELQGIESSHVVAKTKFSMWTPEVQDILQREKYESALIVGIESHVCVLQTALELLRNDIMPYVLADGVSSCNAQEVPIALEAIRQAGGVVTTSETILFRLVGDASAPLFKPFASLVKDEKANTASALSALLPTPTSAPKSSL